MRISSLKAMSPLRNPCPKTATSKADATAALDAVLDALTAVAGNQVVLAGRFETRERAVAGN